MSAIHVRFTPKIKAVQIEFSLGKFDNEMVRIVRACI